MQDTNFNQQAREVKQYIDDLNGQAGPGAISLVVLVRDNDQIETVWSDLYDPPSYDWDGWDAERQYAYLGRQGYRVGGIITWPADDHPDIRVFEGNTLTDEQIGLIARAEVESRNKSAEESRRSDEAWAKEEAERKAAKLAAAKARRSAGARKAAETRRKNKVAAEQPAAAPAAEVVEAPSVNDDKTCYLFVSVSRHSSRVNLMRRAKVKKGFACGPQDYSMIGLRGQDRLSNLQRLVCSQLRRARSKGYTHCIIREMSGRHQDWTQGTGYFDSTAGEFIGCDVKIDLAAPVKLSEILTGYSVLLARTTEYFADADAKLNISIERDKAKWAAKEAAERQQEKNEVAEFNRLTAGDALAELERMFALEGEVAQ